MKILHSSKIIGIAGSENYFLNILPELNKEPDITIEFLLLTPHDKKGTEDAFRERIEAKGVKTQTLYYKEYPTPKVQYQISKIYKNGNYDACHTHLIHADFFFAVTKMTLCRSMVLFSTKHGYDEGYNNQYGFDPQHNQKDLYWRIARFSEKQVNRAFAISKGLYNLYEGLGICPAEKLDMIHYGFDLPDEATFDDSYRKAKVQLAMVGRLTGFKGHRYALEAIKVLKTRYDDLKLVIVGSGPLEEELKAMTKELDIESHVEFIGYHPNGRGFMDASDIVLIPSRAEGFGVVVLEAFAAKRPVVAFNVPSLDEHIIDQKSGRLIPPYDVEQYADAIDHLIQHPELRDEFAQEAYHKLRNYYTLDRMKQQTIEFYKNQLHK